MQNFEDILGFSNDLKTPRVVFRLGCVCFYKKQTIFYALFFLVSKFHKFLNEKCSNANIILSFF